MIKRAGLAALGMMLLFSCTARIDGTLRSGGSGELRIRASLEAQTAALIRSLQTALGEGGRNSPLIDGAALGRSLAAAPGIASASFSNLNPSTVEGSIVISRAGDFLAATANRDRPFVTWQENGSSGSLRLSLDSGSAPALIALISEEVSAYLEALMAPAITGEKLSPRAYLDLVASFYGSAVANEIAASRIHLYLEFPQTVTRIRGGPASGTRASFDISLLDLLVLENPLIYEAAW
jgi:hypothetical protein